MKLRKETINSIKKFINYEVEKHKDGTWDQFILSWINIYANGEYSFKVHYTWKVAGEYDDYTVEGNFEDLPIQSVLDGLDATQLIFYPIHKKAYERVNERYQKYLQMNEEDYEYLTKIYKNREYV